MREGKEGRDGRGGVMLWEKMRSMGREKQRMGVQGEGKVGWRGFVMVVMSGCMLGRILYLSFSLGRKGET